MKWFNRSVLQLDFHWPTRHSFQLLTCIEDRLVFFDQRFYQFRQLIWVLFRDLLGDLSEDLLGDLFRDIFFCELTALDSTSDH